MLWTPVLDRSQRRPETPPVKQPGRDGARPVQDGPRDPGKQRTDRMFGRPSQHSVSVDSAPGERGSSTQDPLTGPAG